MLLAFGIVAGLGLLALVLVVLAVNRSREASRLTQPTQRARGERPPANLRPAPADPVADERPAGRDGDRSGDVATAALSWLTCIGLAVFGYVLASILMAIWVIRDSRNRSVENGVLWMLLIFPFNALALLIYLASRPHGSLIPCERCGNPRLTFVGVCPHCHQPVRARGRAG
jgi:hypothetical protein